MLFGRQIAILSLVSAVSSASVESDSVTGLPGLNKLTSPLYSGYIKATTGNQTFYTHYLLTEARQNADTAPLVIWQQGGPGSSGMGFGWLAELGPYTLNSGSMHNDSMPAVFHNPKSFDRLANVLIFEHPPGTGFSYCADEKEKPTPCVWNDQTQAEAFEATLIAWYGKWPEYSSRDLFLMGESYAGLLLPHLVDKRLDSPDSTPMKQLRAMAIGNGCPGTSGATPEKPGSCNGPYGDYDTEHVFELISGHGGVPRHATHHPMVICPNTKWPL